MSEKTNQSIIGNLEAFCDKREEASWESSNSADESSPVLGQEEAIRDTIELFRMELKRLKG